MRLDLVLRGRNSDFEKNCKMVRNGRVGGIKGGDYGEGGAGNEEIQYVIGVV